MVRERPELGAEPAAPKSYDVLGWIGTALWVVLSAALLAWKRSAIQELSLGEWGSFLSGVAAPLALFWLVLGYLQQGEELRQNTAALRLQYRELVNQVAETAALVEQSQRQAETARLALTLEHEKYEEEVRRRRRDKQPVLTQMHATASGQGGEITMRNDGGWARSLSIRYQEGGTYRLDPPDSLLPMGQVRFTHSDIAVFPAKFAIGYRDEDGEHGEIQMILERANSLRQVD